MMSRLHNAGPLEAIIGCSYLSDTYTPPQTPGVAGLNRKPFLWHVALFILRNSDYALLWIEYS